MKDRNYRRAQRAAFNNGTMAVKKDKKSFFAQFSSLRNVPRFFRMIWDVSPRLAIWNIVLRLTQSAIPLGMLYVGKVIIDLVLALLQTSSSITSFADLPADSGGGWAPNCCWPFFPACSAVLSR